MNTYKYTDESNTTVSVSGDNNGSVPAPYVDDEGVLVNYHRFWDEWGIAEAEANGEIIAHDFKTPETLFAEELVMSLQSAQDYLKQTDWMVIRQFETGIAIPSDISVKRDEARKVANNTFVEPDSNF